MKFQAAFSYLKRGHDITLPEWGGFWRWDADKKTIQMHTRRGAVIDIRQSEDMDYTLSFIFRDDWELVKGANRPERPEQSREALPPTLRDLDRWESKGDGPRPWFTPRICPACGQCHASWLPCLASMTTCETAPSGGQ